MELESTAMTPIVSSVSPSGKKYVPLTTCSTNTMAGSVMRMTFTLPTGSLRRIMYPPCNSLSPKYYDT